MCRLGRSFLTSKYEFYLKGIFIRMQALQKSAALAKSNWNSEVMSENQKCILGSMTGYIL